MLHWFGSFARRNATSMPTIEANGIKIEASVSGPILRFQVLEQSKDATKIITILRQVNDPDEKSGYTLRVNNRPHLNKSSGVFFLRGADKTHHSKIVEANMGSSAKATEALAALGRLVNNVKMPEGTDGSDHLLDKEPLRGGTTDVRMAFINKAQAKKLHLTAKDFYPEECRWKPDTTPIVTVNAHYNEHIAQVVDVLNKAHGSKKKTKYVIHGEKVNDQDAKWAYDSIRALFDAAEKNGNGCLVAVWRALTGLRGPDFVDRTELPSTHR
jgi:hypothetical protein